MKGTQSRRMSMVESIGNVVIGYLVAIASQILIFPFFGIQVSLGENLMIGLFFTVISIVRSYVLRRVFNAIRQQ